jgi:hypothetical protein
MAAAIAALEIWGYVALRHAGLTGLARPRKLLLNFSIGVAMIGPKLLVPH